MNGEKKWRRLGSFISLHANTVTVGRNYVQDSVLRFSVLKLGHGEAALRYV